MSTARFICCAARDFRSVAPGAARYLELMSHDKKVIAGCLRLVLLKGIGNAVTSAEAPAKEIAAAIEACCDA